MIYPNTLLHHRYLVLHQIREGRQGTIYEAIDQRLGHRVALKEIMINNPRMMGAFEREARLLASLNHPGLPHVSDYFRDGESQFLVMQYIPGYDLDKLLRKQGRPFGVELVVKWGEQLLDVLEYLHAHNPPVIHRDIKPANLKLSSRGQLILLDFGMSKGGLVERAETMRMKHKTRFAYTLSYAPLEQINGKNTDERSDLYSLAATLYYLLTASKLPTAATRAGAQITENPDPLLLANQLNPEVPSPLAYLLAQAMSLNPAQRPASAAAMRAALKQATGSKTRRMIAPVSNNDPPPRTQQIAMAPPTGAFSPQIKKRHQRPTSYKRRLATISILALLAAISLLLLIIVSQFYPSSESQPDSVAEQPKPTATSQATETALSTLEPSVTEEIEVASSPPVGAISSPKPSATSENQTEQLAPTETATSTPTLPNEDARFSEKDGMIMLSIPAGEFLMGSLNDDPLAEQHEKPPRTIYLDAFWIDQTEITNAMFARFVEETGYQSDAESEGESYVYVGEEKWEKVEGANWQYPQGPDCNCADEEMSTHPVVQISWNDAQMYCQWAGRRLPTEAEWEKAARGLDSRRYPWGNQEVSGNLVNYCDNNCLLDWAERYDDDGYKLTAPVASYPDAASPFGALDMAGNVWEWVADWYDGNGTQRVLRGGSWSNGSNWVRSALRYYAAPIDANDERGFRCASAP